MSEGGHQTRAKIVTYCRPYFLPHMVHMKGFSLVCDRICRSRWSVLAKLLPQVVHWRILRARRPRGGALETCVVVVEVSDMVLNRKHKVGIHADISSPFHALNNTTRYFAEKDGPDREKAGDGEFVEEGE